MAGSRSGTTAPPAVRPSTPTGAPTWGLCQVRGSAARSDRGRGADLGTSDAAGTEPRGEAADPLLGPDFRPTGRCGGRQPPDLRGRADQPLVVVGDRRGAMQLAAMAPNLLSTPLDQAPAVHQQCRPDGLRRSRPGAGGGVRLGDLPLGGQAQDTTGCACVERCVLRWGQPSRFGGAVVVVAVDGAVVRLTGPRLLRSVLEWSSGSRAHDGCGPGCDLWTPGARVAAVRYSRTHVHQLWRC